jgi:hypothetical protein
LPRERRGPSVPKGRQLGKVQHHTVEEREGQGDLRVRADQDQGVVEAGLFEHQLAAEEVEVAATRGVTRVGDDTGQVGQSFPAGATHEPILGEPELLHGLQGPGLAAAGGGQHHEGPDVVGGELAVAAHA